ncbi:LysR family transcriptional regulator [Pseudobacteriovorax antillogorgiicola]|uniref:Transcriptional regulator, LysR family n=1 Tax=Pseudobacteriovorax antillogorgiicola TaxID=1513793 RepID=A0A1Y6CQM4_9BACT|nr:LysR family transcriptional regulator [Pseudobacteriovorax antillogorgiicola]TCS42217.1 LysR family transcriptional regulator [Pseudobacteriovorax antillogorgiicola]SMF82784.1 transcriptional regulator, LysR family [Pseudobacteriovorax antillogorgiicola]
MDISHLAVFIEVMKKGSFAAVAKDRHIAPSTVSRIVAGLEEHSQTRLFERNTRKLEPTEAAHSLHTRLEPLLEEIIASFDELQDTSSQVQGPLRITSPVSLGLVYLSPWLTQFSIDYPKVSIDYLMTDDRVDIINEKIDVAFRFGQLDDSNFISQKLFKLKYIACASPEYLQREGKPRTPKDIVQHNCLSFLIPGFSTSWKFKALGKAKISEYPISGNLRISNAMGLKESALQGHGISLLPEFTVRRDLVDQQLINLFPSYEISATNFDSYVWVVFPSRTYLSKRTRALLDFVKQQDY